MVHVNMMIHLLPNIVTRSDDMHRIIFCPKVKDVFHRESNKESATPHFMIHISRSFSRKGASIYDGRKIFGFFDRLPPLSHTEISWFWSFCLLFGDPPPPPCADVIQVWPLVRPVFSSPSIYDREVRNKLRSHHNRSGESVVLAIRRVASYSCLDWPMSRGLSDKIGLLRRP